MTPPGLASAFSIAASGPEGWGDPSQCLACVRGCRLAGIRVCTRSSDVAGIRRGARGGPTFDQSLALAKHKTVSVNVKCVSSVRMERGGGTARRNICVWLNNICFARCLETPLFCIFKSCMDFKRGKNQLVGSCFLILLHKRLCQD